jgi:hypothetical protein
MEAASLLEEYGRSVGLPALAFDAHGCVRLRFDGGADVNLELDTARDCIHLYSVLGSVPPGADGSLYERLLEANFFGADTRGAAHVIDPVRREFLLWRRVDLDIQGASTLATAIDGLSAAAREWTGSIASREPKNDVHHQRFHPAMEAVTPLRA